MPTSELENYLENKRKDRFINKTFVDFRNELLKYANSFYKDKILDFSEVSLGGMLLDFASIVGDSLVYYAEQQFNELDYENATDPDNIIKHLKRANIKNSKASPASVTIDFLIEIEKNSISPEYNPKPKEEHLPIIKKGTILSSDSGIQFTLQEDIDFSFGYTQEIGEENSDGTIFSLFLEKSGICTSGQIEEEIISFPDDSSTNNYFLSTVLNNENITDIVSIFDNENNEYFEVEYLTQTTVYKKVKNSNDNYLVAYPAPYRFIKEENYDIGKTIIRFGNGSGKSVKDNVFSNPEDLLLPIKGKDVINRVSLDPSMLLKNNTLGVSPSGKTLTIKYKFGGGIDHNVPSNSITSIEGQPIVVFPNAADILSNSITNPIIQSISVNNKNNAVGGTQPLTLNELKLQIPNAIRAQSRIITDEDLLSRILTMPTDFGKVNKIASLENPHSAFSKDLFVICKDQDGFYTEATDAIKTNLSHYLNDYRQIGSSYNILDVPVFNFGVEVKIKVKSGFEIEEVIFDIISRIIENMRFDLLQIGSPIEVDMIYEIIRATDGVTSIITPESGFIISKSSVDEFFDPESLETQTYNENVFNPNLMFNEGKIYPPRGGIFEMRYTTNDINIVIN